MRGDRVFPMFAVPAIHTLGVCDLTLPARASEPWTLPMIAVCCFGWWTLVVVEIGRGSLWWRF